MTPSPTLEVMSSPRRGPPHSPLGHSLTMLEQCCPQHLSAVGPPCSVCPLGGNHGHVPATSPLLNSSFSQIFIEWAAVSVFCRETISSFTIRTMLHMHTQTHMIVVLRPNNEYVLIFLDCMKQDGNFFFFSFVNWLKDYKNDLPSGADKHRIRLNQCFSGIIQHQKPEDS